MISRGTANGRRDAQLNMTFASRVEIADNYRINDKRKDGDLIKR